MQHTLNCSGYQEYENTIVSASGCYVTNEKGKQYLDLESGVWCTVLGHNHPAVLAAMTKQMEKVLHVGYRYTTAVVDEAAKLLLDVAKVTKGKCVFLSSGSEAVELAIRMAKKVTGKPYGLCLENHYISAYGQGSERRKEEWITIDWSAYGEDFDDAAETALFQDIPFEDIGVFVFEPGNSSGLVKLPPKKLVQAIVKRIKEHQGLVVVDEVTTGIGRTGRWFGFEHYELVPDLIACGKGLGNGYPVSAVVIQETVAMELEQSKFVYAQSHQNDPIGCAVVKEVLSILKKERWIEKARSTGEYLVTRLNELAVTHPIITQIRARGLMIAMEFDLSIGEEALNQVHRALFDRGCIVGIKPAFHTMRLYPPLIVEKEMMDYFVESLAEVLKER